ncbi:MAG TPA: FG-GAP-like repeat-containing protein [Ferruginibacter sp.]|nr:FG-GAP-like repeat-containing protein [Ferruginibacter sp.]
MLLPVTHVFSQAPVINSFTPVSAANETKVTIKGLYFTGTTAVSFGNIAALSFIIFSDTVITAVVGAGATGNVSVTNNSGTGFLPGFIAVPVISSFFPQSGRPGTEVTITGTNFNPSINGNIVYFGPVKATVVFASENMLKATVPKGASYDFVTVLANGLSAYSQKPFTPTFSNGNLTANSFDQPFYLNLNELQISEGAVAGDFDGDGKTDIAVATNAELPGGYIGIFRNISTPGKLKFEPIKNFPIDRSVAPPAAVDFDGDGKLDILVKNGPSDDCISVLKNLSTPGNIEFAQKINLSSFSRVTWVTATDINGDGKPDIVAVNQQDSSVSIYKNTSANGNISFANRINLRTLRLPIYMRIQDMNKDNKPDIVVTHSKAFTKVPSKMSVFQNTSKGGNTSFATRIDYEGNSRTAIAVADIDNDDWPDIITANPIDDSSNIIFKNVSTIGGAIQITEGQNFSAKFRVLGICVGDYDGDGKIDLGLTNVYSNSSMSLMKNISSPGTFSFSELSVPIRTYAYWSLITDLDYDERPDIIIQVSAENFIYALRNRMGENFSICPGSSLNLSSNIGGNNYQWQSYSNGVYTNLANDVNYSGVNDSTLLINNIPISWYGKQYRCNVDSDSSSLYMLKLSAYWTGAADTTWENPANWNCNMLPNSNTDVIINTGNVVLNSKAEVRTLTIKDGAQLIIKPPYSLTTKY